jgi:hypothetical protein
MLLTPFDSPDIIRVEIGLFGQPLLAQMQPLPLFADGCTKDNAVIRRRHSLKRKQRLPRITTPLNG